MSCSQRNTNHSSIITLFQKPKYRMKNFPILAAALLVAGVANAQSPVTTYSNPAATPETAVVTRPGLPAPTVAGPGGYGTAYSNYNQDSRILQSGIANIANVDQTDARSSFSANTGSSATIDQAGFFNTANQKQTLNNSSNGTIGGQGRNVLSSSQAGVFSQTDQVQVGGYYNTAEAVQQSNSFSNQATQTQTGGSENSAKIVQTTGSSSNNAIQEQNNGGTDNTALITQKGSSSYAKQSQSIGTSNDATVLQGALGSMNTAIQKQTGSENRANIIQSDASAGSKNYAEQNQSGYADQARIEQKGSNSFARQDQSGPNFFGIDPNNMSSITQSNVASAAYTNQSGIYNTATVVQH